MLNVGHSPVSSSQANNFFVGTSIHASSNGTQLLSYNEFAEFAEEFVQGTKGWDPKGFPLNLWAHFLSHSKLIVMTPLSIKEVKGCEIYE